MLTWILIIFAIAAVFGIINIEKLKTDTVNFGKKAWPHIKQYLKGAQEKLKEIEMKNAKEAPKTEDQNKER